jgi:hypothetical protein
MLIALKQIVEVKESNLFHRTILYKIRINNK